MIYGAVLLLVVAIVLTSVGQLLIKKGALTLEDGQSLLKSIPKNPWLLGGLGCAIIAPMGYMMALRQIPLSVAFPSMSATYILVSAGASVFFEERMSPLSWFSIALIVAGLTFIGVSS